jgi:hypothetical protein
LKKGPLVGSYWWRTVNHVDCAWDNRAFSFVDDRAVDSGLPASCTTPPAKRGKIHLAFADGTARGATFAVLTKDDTLQPDPVVGVDSYYPDPFPGS